MSISKSKQFKMDGTKCLFFVPLLLLSILIGYGESAHCYDYEYYTSDCDDDSDGANTVVGAVIGVIVGIVIIAAITAVICTKCCKRTKHGAVINPNGGTTTQTFTHSTMVQPGGFFSGYSYATPSAPPQIWSSSNTYSTPQSWSTSANSEPPPPVFPGPSSPAEYVPPPPAYSEAVSNHPPPPKY